MAEERRLVEEEQRQYVDGGEGELPFGPLLPSYFSTTFPFSTLPLPMLFTSQEIIICTVPYLSHQHLDELFHFVVLANDLVQDRGGGQTNKQTIF